MTPNPTTPETTPTSERADDEKVKVVMAWFNSFDGYDTVREDDARGLLKALALLDGRALAEKEAELAGVKRQVDLLIAWTRAQTAHDTHGGVPFERVRLGADFEAFIRHPKFATPPAVETPGATGVCWCTDYKSGGVPCPPGICPSGPDPDPVPEVVRNIEHVATALVLALGELHTTLEIRTQPSGWRITWMARDDGEGGGPEDEREANGETLARALTAALEQCRPMPDVVGAKCPACFRGDQGERCTECGGTGQSKQVAP